MNIIRRYKIHKLFKNSLTKNELKYLNFIFKQVKYCQENYKLIEYIYNNFFNLKKIKFKKYNLICYFKENKCIFYIENGIIYFNYKITKNNLANTFGLIISKYYNIKSVYYQIAWNHNIEAIEDEYNKKI